MNSPAAGPQAASAACYFPFRGGCPGAQAGAVTGMRTRRTRALAGGTTRVALAQARPSQGSALLGGPHDLRAIGGWGDGRGGPHAQGVGPLLRRGSPLRPRFVQCLSAADADAYSETRFVLVANPYESSAVI